ncbi:MAG: 50S ribosomal protein L15 [Planctomycetales bacterium]|nr:50S ribosomal protein L15 [Planctomycetales bacterium]NIM07582.1 50S ribosomal protein L15 [Planctomycetales bacterium]NIN07088.1 50S ribosomal protein L15 [Planctomycetales bacterium]NIN76182.1 50S ribosomal protein L15 [Planctomycetales bacterium]NIO33404.1 50S ribosomal protein L15 [Planctomycetales bacterium]
MNLHDIHRGIQKNKRKRRVGRGPGSGHGKTCGRGHKGQGSRSGSSRQVTFQGGTMPLVRRIPKRGFHNQWALTVGTINVSDLETAFADGDEVTPVAAVEKRLIGPKVEVFKVLGNGELTKKLTVAAHRFSRTAAEKIKQAGGTVKILPGKKPVVKNRQGSKVT